MLPRILEPEVMDSADEALAYDRMDHDRVNRQFVDDLFAAVPELADSGFRGELLDLGTGPARIPVEIYRRNSVLNIVASDLAASMLDLARLHVELAGATERIRLDRADAKALPYADTSFDVVLSNSIVHHLPDPQLAITEAIRVVRPGGSLFFRDLCRPPSEQAVMELVQTYAGQESPPARAMFAASLRAALTLEEMRDLIARHGFSPATVQMTSDRHWTWSARRSPTPSPTSSPE